MATTFAKRIEKAATDLPGATSTAWVQYLVGPDGRNVDVRMQAPEIMKQFRGAVKFGTDPKGILFFGAVEDLNIIGNIKVRNARYPVVGSSTLAIVETEFASPGGPESFDLFARFVGEVDTATYKIPANFTNNVGSGQMKDFDAVTCHVTASRPGRGATISLGTNSIHKQVFFTTNINNSRIDQSGVMFFVDLNKLKTQPNGRDFCMADYNPDRISFYVAPPVNEFVALFLPNKPMDKIGVGIQKVTWGDIDASTMSAMSAPEGEVVEMSESA